MSIHHLAAVALSTFAAAAPAHAATDTQAELRALIKQDAYPAAPQDAYGWEKLMTERLCEYYRRDHGIETRIVASHGARFGAPRLHHDPGFAAEPCFLGHFDQFNFTARNKYFIRRPN